MPGEQGRRGGERTGTLREKPRNNGFDMRHDAFERREEYAESVLKACEMPGEQGRRGGERTGTLREKPRNNGFDMRHDAFERREEYAESVLKACEMQANKDGADLNLETVTKAWKERPDWLRPPPVVTAATLPVIALSLVSKTITGHGLPGSFLGTIEGFSYLTLPLGVEALAPRLKTFFNSKDLSYEKLLQCLTEESMEKRPGDTMSARERIALLRPDPNSEFGRQLYDLAKAEEQKEKESEDARKAREELNKRLASEALGVGTKQSQKEYEDAEKEGSTEKLLSKSVVETVSECLTSENYDADIKEKGDSGETLNKLTSL
eukprot:CAMPEP_0113932258 /NCGR_PEP_ID=MMETSP1159-20121227/7014_1 /TAXON_ID=88271 /ORGANISM="Picocystis salinarum" /LENGTH=321 /DNA_ID=CAMNT_0000933349 /DNA_START=1 /DNA_END=967 /DNA_ORIENTATION=+ /assembly_acc=CAM_ASM_000767